MMDIHQDILEKHKTHDGARASVVRADEQDTRDWLRSAPMCSELARYRIAHCGIMHASHPMQIAREHLSGTFFLASFGGVGEIMIDGMWRRVPSGIACVQPPFISNALRAVGHARWSFCWVRYQEPPETHPLVSIHSPAMASFDSEPLRRAIQGLHADVSLNDAPRTAGMWTQLVHSYVMGFADPFRGDDRLQHIWEAVERDPRAGWTLPRLAKMAGVSKEHLRRLTTASVGRTPIQHVTFLRMHHAAKLLITTDWSVSEVAERVAFSSPFSFSNTFLRWYGTRPSEYRDIFGKDAATLVP